LLDATIRYGSIRGDMTETRIITEEYHSCVAPTLDKGNVYVTRANDLRLKMSHVKYDLRMFDFFH